MTEIQLAVLLVDVALIAVVAQLAGRLCRVLSQPAVIGEIVAGILAGPTLFHGAVAGALFPVGVRPYLTMLANFGLVLFMFVVGLEFDSSRLRGSGRIAGATALGATVVPFTLGSSLALFLADEHNPPNQSGFVLFMGVALAVTAFPVLARILTDRGMNRSLLGTIALSSAAVCDLAAWSMLAAVQAIGGDRQNHWLLLLIVPYAALLLAVVRPVLMRLLAMGAPSSSLSSARFSIVLAGLLISAAVTQLIGLHFVFGAFLFGLAVPRTRTDCLREEMSRRTQAGSALLLPAYFIVTGLNVDLSVIGSTGVLALILVIVTAVTGKFAGSFVAARACGLSARGAAVLGTLMNTRGLTELVVLGVGLQAGMLDRELYSLMVVMAVVTTAMTGPLLQWLAGGHGTDIPEGEIDRSHPGWFE